VSLADVQFIVVEQNDLSELVIRVKALELIKEKEVIDGEVTVLNYMKNDSRV
jgi:hypothetical protein